MIYILCFLFNAHPINTNKKLLALKLFVSKIERPNTIFLPNRKINWDGSPKYGASSPNDKENESINSMFSLPINYTMCSECVFVTFLG